MQMACHDVVMRDQIRLVPSSMIGNSALDVLDGLVNIIDDMERIMNELHDEIDQLRKDNGRGRRQG